jgi:hypothetical protein
MAKERAYSATAIAALLPEQASLGQRDDRHSAERSDHLRCRSHPAVICRLGRQLVSAYRAARIDPMIALRSE